MLSYEDMKYIAAFAKIGTLSEVAQKYNISQPTITRAMKKAEVEFGVPLFDRTKNSIKLNNNGVLAVEEISIVLKRTDEMFQRVRAYDRANRTIFIGSGAAVQLPNLINLLTQKHPEATISSELKKPNELEKGLENNTYQLIILPYNLEHPDYVSIKIGEEHLMFSLPPNHKFAKCKTLTMAQMNGENMLLFSEIGFWSDIVHEKMPDSRFLIQNERYTFEELITNSVLPCFTTDMFPDDEHSPSHRIRIPITDEEVNVSYYLICKKDKKSYFSNIFTNPDIPSN
ncbi:MAG: LysR family transcriptional regulator [Anaerotignaceae bacterium]